MKGEAEKYFLGQSVVTGYNNKSYRIDEVDFSSSPKSTFTNSKGETLSYLQYYKNQYGLNISDPDQPMFISRAKKNPTEEKGVDK